MKLSETLAELTVVGSYSRLGFERRARNFEQPAPDAMRGRTVVITGASSGIGLASASELARLGAHVVLVARNPARLAPATDAVARVASGPPPTSEICDLAELGQVRDLASRLEAALPRIDALILNAGVLLNERTRTSEGHETSFATNVLSGFLLAQLAWPLLRRAEAPRLIHVTSGGMYTQALDLNYLEHGGGKWDGVKTYAQTKRAQVVLNELWAQRMAGLGGVSHAMHPGWADTPGVESSLPGFHRLTRGLLRTAEQGADTASWLAWSDAPLRENGALYLDRVARRTVVFPGTATSPETARALWELCADRCGLDPGAPPMPDRPGAAR